LNNFKLEPIGIFVSQVPSKEGWKSVFQICGYSKGVLFFNTIVTIFNTLCTSLHPISLQLNFELNSLTFKFNSIWVSMQIGFGLSPLMHNDAKLKLVKPPSRRTVWGWVTLLGSQQQWFWGRWGTFLSHIFLWLEVLKLGLGWWWCEN
jgi:hypothetical protein